MKTALITGAHRGLGLETAKQLSDRGCKVILTARRTKEGEEAASKIEGATFLRLDINDPDSIAAAAAQVDTLDVLINNAAILLGDGESVLNLPSEMLEQTLATNVLNTLKVTQAFVPHLLKSAAGRIVNVSSASAQLSDMGTRAPAYSISKTTLNAVTCQLAAALKEKGIAVNSVSPGWCRTEMGGPEAPRSAEEGAAGIVWLAVDAPQDKTGLFWRDREVIAW